MIENRLNFGQIIKHALNVRGITQKEYAKKTGTHEYQVSKWCNAIDVNTRVLVELAEFLNVDIIELFMSPDELENKTGVPQELQLLVNKILSLPVHQRTKFLFLISQTLDMLLNQDYDIGQVL